MHLHVDTQDENFRLLIQAAAVPYDALPKDPLILADLARVYQEREDVVRSVATMAHAAELLPRGDPLREEMISEAEIWQAELLRELEEQEADDDEEPRCLEGRHRCRGSAWASGMLARKTPTKRRERSLQLDRLEVALRYYMTLAALVLLLPACSTDEPAAVEDNYPPPDPLGDEYRTCAVDADCVIVQLGLCDHCNGGVAVAVNEDSEQTVFDAYAEAEPTEEWGCTLMACDDLEAVCDQGLCIEQGGDTTL